MLPALKVGAEPIRPEASRPCIGVEHAQSKDTPLLCAPCRVEPKRLTEHTKYTRPTPPAFTLVLRKPDRDDAAKGDANLIQAQSPLPDGAPQNNKTWPRGSRSGERHQSYRACVLLVTSVGFLWA